MIAHGETVTRLRAPLMADRYSAATTAYDWTSATSLDLPHVAIDPGGSQEPTQDGRASVVTQPTLYDPNFYDITSGDRILARGRTFEVDGEPAQWKSHPFTGWSPGQVVKLKEVAG